MKKVITPEELDSDIYTLKGEKIATALMTLFFVWFWIDSTASSYNRDFKDILGFISLVINIVSFILAFRLFSKGLLEVSVVILIVGVIYNPFIPVKAGSDSWMFINFAAIIAYAWSFWRIRKTSHIMAPDNLARQKELRGLSDAIDEAVNNGDLDQNEIDDFMRKMSGKN